MKTSVQFPFLPWTLLGGIRSVTLTPPHQPHKIIKKIKWGKGEPCTLLQAIEGNKMHLMDRAGLDDCSKPCFSVLSKQDLDGNP